MPTSHHSVVQALKATADHLGIDSRGCGTDKVATQHVRAQCVRAIYARIGDARGRTQIIELEAVAYTKPSTFDDWLSRAGKAARDKLKSGEWVEPIEISKLGNRKQVPGYDLDKIDAFLAAEHHRTWQEIHDLLRGGDPDDWTWEDSEAKWQANAADKASAEARRAAVAFGEAEARVSETEAEQRHLTRKWLSLRRRHPESPETTKALLASRAAGCTLAETMNRVRRLKDEATGQLDAAVKSAELAGRMKVTAELKAVRRRAKRAITGAREVASIETEIQQRLAQAEQEDPGRTQAKAAAAAASAEQERLVRAARKSTKTRAGTNKYPAVKKTKTQAEQSVATAGRTQGTTHASPATATNRNAARYQQIKAAAEATRKTKPEPTSPEDTASKWRQKMTDAASDSEGNSSN